MNSRQQWREFICDPARPARYLSSIGSAVISGNAPPVAPDVLDEFLRRLSSVGAAVELLADAVDLIFPAYQDFVTEQLPRLLDALTTETVNRNEVVGPAMRGAVRWGPTIVARRAGSLMPTQFMVRQPSRSAALPENRLVVWLVNSIMVGIKNLERRINSDSLPPGLLNVRTACQKALKDDRLADLALPREPEQHMLVAAQRHRLPSYRAAAKLAERRMGRVCGGRDAKWLRILDLLAAEWLEPIKDEDLFELFMLALVLDILKNELGLGEPQELGLCVRDRKHVAAFRASDSSVVRVYFDQSPVTALRTTSVYQSTIGAHDGVVGSARRPDVIVEREVNGERVALLIEAKESSDQDYIQESVYKGLAYVHDFQGLWNVGNPRPKIVLLFPDGAAPKANVSVADLDVVLTNGGGRPVLVESLSVRLGLPRRTSANDERH